MADFEQAFSKTMGAEGGYKLTDIKGDKGGQTYAGISRRFHPDFPQTDPSFQTHPVFCHEHRWCEG